MSVKYRLFRILIITLCISDIKGRILNVWNNDIENITSGDPQNCATYNQSTDTLNRLFQNLSTGDTLLFPSGHDFWFTGGMFASNVIDITIQIDGSINFQNKFFDEPNDCAWPLKKNHPDRTCGPINHDTLECICIMNTTNLTVTSNNIDKGLINGGAFLKDYWFNDTIDGIPVNIKYQHGPWWGLINLFTIDENRPKIISGSKCKWYYHG